jgi:hypothetical protein
MCILIGTIVVEIQVTIILLYKILKFNYVQCSIFIKIIYFISEFFNILFIYNQ